MTIERPSSSMDLTEKKAFWIALPDECVVLSAMTFKDTIAAMFWSNKIFDGAAATTRNCFVLVPTRRRDVAWIESALSDPLVTAQLLRATVGSFLPRISVADLLEIKIRRLSQEEERVKSQLVRKALTKRGELLRLSSAIKNRRTIGGEEFAARVPVLTAATFEQRMEQFERLLIEDKVADRNMGFFVQAARKDHESDLFVINCIGEEIDDASDGAIDLKILSHENEDANRTWRQWYWDKDSGIDFTIFNAIVGGPELPAHLIIRSVADPERLAVPASGNITVPAFAEFQAAIEASQDADGEIDLSGIFLDQDERSRAGSNEIGRLWERLNPGLPPTNRVISWLRAVFRPILAIRVIREDQVSGAYLLFGADQLEDPSGAVALLELLGERLVAVLRQPSQIAEEAARSESLRRLSWMMHQLGGPLSTIGNVVEELADFANANPKAAATLLPDDRRATERANMNELPIENYTLGARLKDLEASVDEIRRLQYLIRRYKNAQSELQIVQFDLRELLERLAANARGQLMDLHVHVECDPGLVVQADRARIREALNEVVRNTCRECRLRSVAAPNMILVGERKDNRAIITIEDNGLPTDVELLPDVFAEDASTYRAQGKGCGMGLAIVKETFRRHGSRCQLKANMATNGSRRPGVTFWADLTISRAGEDNIDV
jgi:signal transduction histidine kinase